MTVNTKSSHTSRASTRAKRAADNHTTHVCLGARLLSAPPSLVQFSLPRGKKWSQNVLPLARLSPFWPPSGQLRNPAETDHLSCSLSSQLRGKDCFCKTRRIPLHQGRVRQPSRRKSTHKQAEESETNPTPTVRNAKLLSHNLHAEDLGQTLTGS